MGVFARVEEVNSEDIFQRKPYFKPGNYRVRILEVRARTNDRNRKVFFIVEAEVLKSDNEHISVGGIHAWVQELTNDAGPGAVKLFIAAGEDVDINSDAFGEINEELCELVISDEQPFAGKEMGLQCHEKLTQNDTMFTVHNWHHIATDD